MDFNTNEFLDAFIEESKDNLEMFYDSITKLEKSKSKNNQDLLNQIFRISHTLKGMAGTMGYERMRSLTHTMEDILQDVRDEKIKLTPDFLKLLFSSHDYLDKCVQSISDTSEEIKDEPHELIEKLESLHAGKTQSVPTEVEKKKTTKAKKKKEEPEVLEENPVAESQEQDVITSEASGKEYDITVSISGECKLLVPRIFIILKTIEENAVIVEATPSYEDLSKEDFNPETFDVHIKVKTDQIEAVLDKLNNVTEVESISTNAEGINTTNNVLDTNIESSNQTPQDNDNQTLEQNDTNIAQAHHKQEEYLRIASSKVDTLADMIGELMIIQSLVEQRVSDKIADDPATAKEMVRMGRLTKDVQNLSMSLRMVPLKSTLQKVVRTGRDTSQQLDRPINIEVFGEDTEIDRNIADKLYTPLMHMVRNSIGHGIEEVSMRQKRGKKDEGSVIINAYNKRGNVYIEIQDDGNGLNLERILKKAIEKGLAQEDRKYTDDEIASFIFLPGFSTAEKVDNVSGRGVGMDVVKTDITKVGGSVRVETEPGMGTKFTLKIPINLAIMNGTIVEIMDKLYILPTLNIREIVHVSDDSWISIKGKEKMLKVRGEVLPIYPIKSLLVESGFDPINLERDEKLMIIIEMEGTVRAIPVQTVLERREIVVKSLGSEFKNLDFISGATILGNGTVALIFDIEGLLKKTEQDI